MKVDNPQVPVDTAVELCLPRGDNVYQFPSGNRLSHKALPAANGEDITLTDLEEALCNWF